MAHIFAKDPKDMTEMEKVIWKVEVQKLCEDTDEMIAEGKVRIEIDRQGIKTLIKDSRQVITSYNEAVDRIGDMAKNRRPKSPLKASNS